MKTILIIAKDGVDTAGLMSDIFREFKDRIDHISNQNHHVRNDDEGSTEKPGTYPWPGDNYVDED
jgi:hypothetical protein